jgi:homospermidine synthase
MGEGCQPVELGWGSHEKRCRWMGIGMISAAMRRTLGTSWREYCDGTPLLRRGRLFPEATDDACPRQFGNFRVV